MTDLNDSVREQYKHLERVARRTGRPPEVLVKGFELEREFHLRVAGEKDQSVRGRLYYEFYDHHHRLYRRTGLYDLDADRQSKTWLVNLLRKELEGKSLLDIGCGEGGFLRSVDAHLEHGKLVGIDISPAILRQKHENIEFLQGDVINFSTDYRFDVVFSDNVIEHIANQDLSLHLRSVKNAMESGGTLIIISPNRLFGPHDVTSIIDDTYTNKIESLGSHLHETTYTELTSILKDHGFSSLKTTIPIARVDYYFPNVRISPRFVQAIENRQYLLSAIYKCNSLSLLLSRLQIVLLCTYSN